MFQILTPQVGDRIYFASTSGIPGISNLGLINRSLIRRPKMFGIAPINRNKDMFGNQSCIHLNLKGQLYASGVQGASRVSLGSYYGSKAMQVLSSYGSGLKFPNYATPITGFLFVGSDRTDEGPTVYQKVYQYTHVTNQRVTYKWLSRRKLRVEAYTYTKRLETGVVLANQCSVTYIEYDWIIPTPRRRSKTVIYQFNDKILSWVQPTTSYSVMSSNHTVTGVSDMPVFKANDFRSRLSQVIRDIPQDDSSSFGQLTLDAAQGLRVVKVNLFTYFIELDWVTHLGSVRGAIKKAVDLLTDLKINPKTVTNAYLASKYGLKLTYLDTKELLGPLRSSIGMSEDRWTSSRARKNSQLTLKVMDKVIDCQNQYNLKLYCSRHSSSIVAAWAQLLVTGLYPLTETAWDAVPFSFVIDWFAKLDRVFAAIDSKTLLKSYKILSCVYSSKATFRIPISDLFPEWDGKVTGLLTVVYYRRYVSRKPPPPYLDYQTPKSFNHWIEGAALIVQQL